MRRRVLTPPPQQGIIRGVIDATQLPVRLRTLLRNWRVLCLLLFACTTCATLGRLPLIDEDEGEYSEVAMEMAQGGSWLAPTLNGQPFYEKPVLLFWLQAPLVRLAAATGLPVEWALRMPAWLASVAWLVTLLRFWRRQRSGTEAHDAVWLAASSLGVAVVARAAAMDALINLFLALTLFDVWHWLSAGSRVALRRAALWAGFGLLAKGPVALVVPAAVVLVSLLVTPAWRGRWRDLCDPSAWIRLLIVCLPWYGWYAMHSDGAFVSYFLGRENVGRLGGSLQGHGGSPAYYLVVLPLLLLPYTAALPGALRAWRTGDATSVQRFLLIWFAVVFVIFTLAGTKLPHYLLYGCTPLFLLGAPALAGAVQARWLALPGLLLPAVALGLPALADRLATHDRNPYIREMLARAPDVLDASWQWRAAGWLALAAINLALVWRRPAPPFQHHRGRSEVLLRWAPGLVSVLGISGVLLPAVTGLQQDPVRAAAQFAATLAAPVVSDNRMPSFSVYLGHATEVRPVRAGDLAFGRLDHPDRLGSQHEVLFARGGVRVVRVRVP